MGVYCNQRQGGKVAIWTLNHADACILQPETGEGAFCPLPVCPTPVEISPTVQRMGRTWRKGRRGMGEVGIWEAGILCFMERAPRSSKIR